MRKAARWRLPDGIHRLVPPRLTARVLPVYSQIIVTAPMSDTQMRTSLPSGNCMLDTRGLLFYYRQLYRVWPQRLRSINGYRTGTPGGLAHAGRIRLSAHD